MSNPVFDKLQSIFLPGLEWCPTASITNTALLAAPILSPGEMVSLNRLGDVTILVAEELAECFTETNGFNEW